jgi:co-chaperonin GroES (HSP10)
MTEENQKGLSYVDDQTLEECEQMIEQTLGFPPMRVTGYNLCLMLYTPPEEIMVKDKEGREIIDPMGISKKIIIPHEHIENSKYSTCVALVCGMGPFAYKAKKYEEQGAWCRVGDWVVIPRHEGVQIMYRDVPMMIIPDDCILGVVDDPTYVKRS